jgi:hypothetical protein
MGKPDTLIVDVLSAPVRLAPVRPSQLALFELKDDCHPVANGGGDHYPIKIDLPFMH